ncbi:MAG TPA: hypothetical protein VN688_12765 [Gemmataceae bacterium]|nr:hypothetical protein [Gemmataceae bacterium]
MSAALAPSWPGSRVLLGWWRELIGRQPQQLWFSRLLLHRVESLVRVTHTRSLDLWQRALLRLVHARIPRGPDPENYFADLQIDGQVLSQLIHQLTAAGLLHMNGAGTWDVTTAGRHALETGALATCSEERRTFYFVDNSELQCTPHFLSLRRLPRALASAPAPDVATWSFDLTCLEACIRQTSSWKTRYHFPADVEAFLPPLSNEPPATNWRRVVLDSPEQLPVVFLRAAGSPGEPTLLGFAARAEGWELEPEPILAFGEGWEEVLPNLAAEPSPQAWREAWQAWSAPRNLPLAEVEACRLERVDHRLLVHAPPPIIDRLRAARSDAVKQEAWLLAGSDRTRTAAQLELVPS